MSLKIKIKAIMINLFAKSEGGKPISIEAPTTWSDVNVSTFQRIASEWDGENQIRLFSILVNRDYTSLRESKDQNLEAVFWACIRFVYQDRINWADLPMPKVFNYKGNLYQIPKNVGQLTLGQNIAIRQRIEQVNASLNPEQTRMFFVDGFLYDEIMAYCISVYMQPIITESEFDTDKAKEIEEEILKMPIISVYSLGFFLLNRQISFGKRFTNGLNRKIVSLISKMRIWLNSAESTNLNHSPT